LKETNKISESFIVKALLLLLLVAAVIVVYTTENSFGGGDHFTHFKLARWGWQYPKLLFNHWGKPVFTILISPFAQEGMDMARMFNVVTGLFTAFVSWKLAATLKFKNSWFVVLLVVFTPVYFSLMFSVMTEVLHSMFLVLAVWLFFKKEYLWSAVAVSFLPMVRTESIVLLPLFLLAFTLKKQWKYIPFFATGFLLVSAAGWHFYNSFWWLITEMPYKGSAAGIYGHGSLFHFINHTKGILGYPIAGLFYLGLAVSLWLWYKTDRFKLNERFYFLLLVPGVYLTFLAAHSFVWWKGMGNSLGLIRVMGSVTPFAALTALAGFNYMEELLQKYKKLFVTVAVLIAVWIVVSAVSIGRNGFKKSNTQEVLAKAVNYIRENDLEKNKIYYFNNYVPFRLGIDPYNDSRSSWGIPASPKVSASIPDNSIIIWDAHFGPNEGGTQLSKLKNDNGLKVIKVFKPEKPFTVLGGYNYEVYLFQKKPQTGKDMALHLDFEGDNPDYSDEIAFEGKKSFYVSGDRTFLNLLVVNMTNIGNDSSMLRVSGEIFTEENFNNDDVLLVVSREGDKSSYFYRTFGLSDVAVANKWSRFGFDLKLAPAKADDELMKVYFWNKKGKAFWIDDITINVTEYRSTSAQKNK